MSEETKQSTEPQADPDGNAKETEDFKAKYATLQAEHQKAIEQLKSAQGTLDTLDQYGAINWDKISGQPQEESKETPAPPKMDAEMQKVLQRQEGKILTLQFRLDNPDLREYEDDLVAPFVMKARTQNPRKSQDDVLKIAAEGVREFLKKHEESVMAKAQAEKAKVDKEKASGLESGAPATPETEVDEEKSRRDYITYRRKQRAAHIGAV